MTGLTILRENIVKNVFVSQRTGFRLCPTGLPSFRLALRKMSLPLKTGRPEEPGRRAEVGSRVDGGAGAGACLLPACLHPLPSAWKARVCPAFPDPTDPPLILCSFQLVPSPLTNVRYILTFFFFFFFFFIDFRERGRDRKRETETSMREDILCHLLHAPH
uniref:Uncharacterized protein n=1 Tax=Molossus molossus TaxID=27622 RepID=A0A7J8HCK8_MOLMO|nr:hypothetical protein HJG59_011133 [Molossus molossus]